MTYGMNQVYSVSLRVALCSTLSLWTLTGCKPSVPVVEQSSVQSAATAGALTAYYYSVSGAQLAAGLASAGQTVATGAGVVFSAAAVPVLVVAGVPAAAYIVSTNPELAARLGIPASSQIMAETAPVQGVLYKAMQASKVSANSGSIFYLDASGGTSSLVFLTALQSAFSGAKTNNNVTEQEMTQALSLLIQAADQAKMRFNVNAVTQVFASAKNITSLQQAKTILDNPAWATSCPGACTRTVAFGADTAVRLAMSSWSGLRTPGGRQLSSISQASKISPFTLYSAFIGSVGRVLKDVANDILDNNTTAYSTLQSIYEGLTARNGNNDNSEKCVTTTAVFDGTSSVQAEQILAGMKKFLKSQGGKATIYQDFKAKLIGKGTAGLLKAKAMTITQSMSSCYLYSLKNAPEEVVSRALLSKMNIWLGGVADVVSTGMPIIDLTSGMMRGLFSGNPTANNLEGMSRLCQVEETKILEVNSPECRGDDIDYSNPVSG